MSQIIDRIQRQLAAAEGYIDLNLPDRALEILQKQADWATMQFEASFLTGETLRMLGRYREALKPLEVAASLRPGDPGVAVALGVMIDTLVVRSVLVTALNLDLGGTIWWPSKLDRDSAPLTAAEVEAPLETVH